jgi:MbtH protein
VSEDSDDPRSYAVLVNAEEQYSLWPQDLAVPPGWRGTGKIGTKQECLDYVRSVWTDMRPLSLRRAMSERSEGQS